MNPLFTIITPTYNAAATLAPTLESVKRQTFTDYEIIVMDGGSKDNTADIARSAGFGPAATIVSEPDKGLYDAMNKAMALARGEYLIFLNAGDTFHSADTLAEIAGVIGSATDSQEQATRPGIVYGQTLLVDSERRPIADRHLTAPADLTFKSFASGMLVCHQAFIARRDIAGKYDMRYRLSADYEWCIRCLQRSTCNVLIDHYLIDYLYEGLSTKNRRRSLRERFSVMCYYYGTLPTVMRHLAFIPRFLRHRSKIRRAVRDASRQ